MGTSCIAPGRWHAYHGLCIHWNPAHAAAQLWGPGAPEGHEGDLGVDWVQHSLGECSGLWRHPLSACPDARVMGTPATQAVPACLAPWASTRTPTALTHPSTHPSIHPCRWDAPNHAKTRKAALPPPASPPSMEGSPAGWAARGRGVCPAAKYIRDVFFYEVVEAGMLFINTVHKSRYFLTCCVALGSSV